MCSKPIVDLVAYIDESGHEANTPHVQLCALVAPRKTWSELDSKWRFHLETQRVKYFHAYDCEHGRGEFVNHSRSLRESMFWGLGETIATTALLKVDAAIDIEKGWKAPELDFVRRAFRAPWYLCLAYCLQQLTDVSRRHLGSRLIDVEISRNQEYERFTDDIVRAHKQRVRKTRISSVRFGFPRDVTGLQAVDLVSYETYQNEIFGIRRENDVKRSAMRRMLNGRTIKIATPFNPRAWRNWNGLVATP